MDDDFDIDGAAKKAARRRLRSFFLAVVANALLAAACLGWPYFRGRQRAAGAVGRFGEFAACLYGAEPASAPGLALPPGDRARFATMVLSAEGDWPEPCRPLLATLAPPPAIFVFPSVKRAETALRVAVDTLDEELASLGRARGGDAARVPSRPLRAVTMLRTALVEQLMATGQEVDVMEEAVVFDPDAAVLPRPSRLPLGTATGGSWAIEAHRDGFVAHGVDARTVAWARYEAERLHPRQTGRPGLVRGLLGPDEPVYAVLATNATRCGQNHCADRPTGLVRFEQNRQRLRAAVSLHAYPAGPPADSVRVRDDGIAVVARTADEGVELARFGAMPEVEVPDRDQEVAPVRMEAVSRLPLLADEPDRVSVTWLDDGVVVAGRSRAVLVPMAPEARPRRLPSPGGGGVQVAACGDALVLASARGAVWMDPDEPDAAVRPELRIDPPEAPHLAVRCVDGAVNVYALARGDLMAARCTDGACGEVRTLAEGVARFDVLPLAGGDALLAVSSDETDGPVRLFTASAEGASEARQVGACWQPEGGVCGAPRLLATDDGILLVTRNGFDLQILRSQDRGATWRALED